MKTKFFFVLAMLGVATLASANEEPVVLSTDGTYSISYDANGNAVGMAAPEHKLGESGLFGRRSDVSLRESAARELRNIRSSIRRTLHFNSMVNDESVASALSDEFSQSASRAGKTVREASANLDRNINAEEATLDASKGITITPSMSGEGPARAGMGGMPTLEEWLNDYVAKMGYSSLEYFLVGVLEATDNHDGTYTFDQDALQNLLGCMWGEEGGVYSGISEDNFRTLVGVESGSATFTPTPGSGARCPVGEPIVLGLMAAGYAALRRRKNEE